MNLFSLSEGIRRCTACPLYRSRMLAVSGEGEGKIMFVGEAPSMEDDRLGLPFVDKSGEYLDELLDVIGLSRHEIFITNAVKCYSGRKVKSSELKTCKSLWLNKQIDIIRPKLIVILGSVVLKSLLGKGNVSELHGKIVKRDGLKYFISYNLSLMGNFKFRKDIFQDFKKLKKIV